MCNEYTPLTDEPLNDYVPIDIEDENEEEEDEEEEEEQEEPWSHKPD